MWNDEGSQSSVSSGEQNEKESGGIYLKESPSFGHDDSSDNGYNNFVHELEMAIAENESSDDSMLFVDIDASLSDVSYERSNTMESSSSVESTETDWEDESRLEDTSFLYRRRSSMVRRRLVVVLTIVFLVTVWKVTNSFTGQQKRPVGIPSNSSKDLQYVSANTSTKEHPKQPLDISPLLLPQQRQRPMISSLQLGPVDEISESKAQASSPVKNLSAMEYQAANLRTRSTASKPEFP